MGVPGVDGLQTETNHVMETWACLGIEAARAKIIQQIDHTMASHGMAIDARHMMLLADCMTYKVCGRHSHHCSSDALLHRMRPWRGVLDRV